MQDRPDPKAPLPFSLLAEIVGWYGMLAILGAYALSSYEVLPAASPVLATLDAANTGHDGCLATMHANNCTGALSRMESMVLRAGINWPHEAIKAQIAATFDYVVFMARVKTGRQLAEIMALDGYDFERKVYVTTPLYQMPEFRQYEQTAFSPPEMAI